VALAFSAPVVCEPVTGLLPDQEPDAVQAVALVVDQVSVELSPFATVLGEAARLIVAAGFALTVTVVD
jgi:hypothetical protein